MDCLKEMKDILVALAVEQLKHPECVNAEEMKDVVKMIKYLQETIYYYTVTEAMEDKYQVGDWEAHPAEKTIEGYVTEVSDEITRMLTKATPAEKQMVQQKMAHIASKIS